MQKPENDRFTCNNEKDWQERDLRFLRLLSKNKGVSYLEMKDLSST